jgi:hypothetical protein
LNVTVLPAGGVPAGAVTVAVNVTDWPNTEGGLEELTVVVVLVVIVSTWVTVQF